MYTIVSVVLHVNGGKVTSWPILANPLAVPSIIEQVP
jgi:hypothetical protein